MINPETAQQQLVDKIYTFSANLMIKEKKTRSETIKVLVSQGIDQNMAITVVNELHKTIVEEKRKKGSRDILFGSLWFVGGIFFTAITLTEAKKGGTYIVAWGAVLFGALQIIRGFINKNYH